jgi:hypothetical protein
VKEVVPNSGLQPLLDNLFCKLKEPLDDKISIKKICQIYPDFVYHNIHRISSAPANAD